MLFAIPFPAIDPVAVEIGPFAIRWYALAYIAGLLLGWRLLRRLMTAPPAVGTLQQADDFLTWATLGVILGGKATLVGPMLGPSFNIVGRLVRPPVAFLTRLLLPGLG